MVSRSIAIALGIICIILIASLGVTIGEIARLNSQISDLKTQITVMPILGVSNYYLPSGNGSDSKIFVLSAYANYGYYPFATRYSVPSGTPVVTEGEPCIIINSTIRNDYPTSMWTFLTGQLFNGETQINTTDLTQVGLPLLSLTYACLNSGENATLSIYLAANNWNITSFKIVLVYVGEIPPP
jgi:hypothetical protein